MLALTLQAQPEKITEIRVHGNATIADKVVIELAGVSEGATLDADGLAAIEKRLRDSGRFDEVQVRKRYRTLAMDEVALVLLVHEKPGVSPSGKPPSAARQIRHTIQLFPILGYEDGYGWTYGARASMSHPFGKGTRLSVPLSLGGTKQAAIEADGTFKSGPLTRLTGSFGVTERENPFYEIDDHRTELKLRAERRLFDKVTLSGETGRSNVSFAAADDQFWSVGTGVTFDTRRDPAYPSDAILASGGWTRLGALGTTATGWAADDINRYKVDGRGYKRVYRTTVLAVRAQFDTASTVLPPYEQPLLGGGNLRGVPAGSFAGDKRLLWSLELRVPQFSNVLSAARVGWNVFLDGGKVAPYGAPLSGAKTYRGAGGGLFIIAAMFQLNFDVAHSLDGKGTRFHFGTGFSF
jgi:outer membrane protein assembly factor BamA